MKSILPWTWCCLRMPCAMCKGIFWFYSFLIALICTDCFCRVVGIFTCSWWRGRCAEAPLDVSCTNIALLCRWRGKPWGFQGLGDGGVACWWLFQILVTCVMSSALPVLRIVWPFNEWDGVQALRYFYGPLLQSQLWDFPKCFPSWFRAIFTQFLSGIFKCTWSDVMYVQPISLNAFRYLSYFHFFFLISLAFRHLEVQMEVKCGILWK